MAAFPAQECTGDQSAFQPALDVRRYLLDGLRHSPGTDAGYYLERCNAHSGDEHVVCEAAVWNMAEG